MGMCGGRGGSAGAMPASGSSRGRGDMLGEGGGLWGDGMLFIILNKGCDDGGEIVVAMVKK